MQNRTTVSESAARRAAHRVGYVARKSRWRKYSVDNRGEFRIIDPETNAIVIGERFDVTADEVMKWCRTLE